MKKMIFLFLLIAWFLFHEFAHAKSLQEPHLIELKVGQSRNLAGKRFSSFVSSNPSVARVEHNPFFQSVKLKALSAGEAWLEGHFLEGQKPVRMLVRVVPLKQRATRKNLSRSYCDGPLGRKAHCAHRVFTIPGWD